MRESMGRLTPVFSANRMVRQYTEEHYIPLMSAYRDRAADPANTGTGLLAWQREIASLWHDLHLGPVAVNSRDGKYFYSVQVYLGRIQPCDVQLELYADPLNSEQPFRVPMTLDWPVPDAARVYRYSGVVPNDRPANHYTPRALPQRSGVSIPLELSLIAWPE